ncbi:hypothetical protein SAMN02745166_02420 [Prosthecobacter debontii]|uniref:Concanavalin A-like lectin/glucanases superfamily protein n=1 Tax=Prosthecobacter debontii TaxID=48467 RepID=A0A1T4Y422_9BACT|nr:hypothetical protein [Prosthecobacter debontii]SKA96549.1 hypothetical protein SAMN02745166_02420 [Prosthecobacter debontii]
MKAAFAVLLLGASFFQAQAAELKPLLAQPDQVVLKDDFSKPGPFNKKQWGARQGTRWVIEDGVLRGRPSTPEYQAKKKDHKGYEPRISSPVTPAQFIAQFSIRFSEGSPTAIVPFVEFGHHVCRLRFSEEGVEIVAEGESVKVAESHELKFEPGRWYHALAEMKGEEFVIQFVEGPTLYAKHPCFAKPAPSGGNGLGVAGTNDGKVELDNVTLWSIQAEAQTGWETKRQTFPAYTPVPLAKKKAK